MCYLSTLYFDILSIVHEWNVSVDHLWSVTDRKTEVLGENLVPFPLYPSRQRKIYLYVWIYICVCVFMYVYLYLYIYIYICVYACVCTCACVYVYIYIYLFIYLFFESFYLWVRNPLSAVVDIQNMTLQDAFHDFISWYTLAWNVGSFFEIRTWIWSARQNISI